MKSIFYSVVVSLLCFTTNAQVQEHSLAPVEKDYVGYLFAYFLGNRVVQESVHFAVSMDGYNYYALNGNRPVLHSADISSTGGVRDPHILRREDGKGFYMVVTDMTSSKGWDSNRAMVLLKSEDLVNWTSSVVNIQQKYTGQENLKRVWAPQTIYDKEAEKYLIYWSMKHDNNPDIIYYSYANKDFTDLATEPKQLFFPQNGRSCIDGDIIFKDSLYYMFYKTEGHGNGIKLATTKSLTSGQWVEKEGYKQLTTDAVEGSSVFKLSNSDTYIFMYDVYMRGEFHFTKSADLETFTRLENEISMNFRPRHGSIIPITRWELKRLTDKWGKPDQLGELPNNPILLGFHADPDILYSKQTGKYYIYSTTCGNPGWSGSYFTVYSSDNLKDWKFEKVMLDLKSDQVPWAVGNAWAPAIEEKLINGKYKYFFYFSGHPVEGRAKQIGVAVADHPLGPFTDLGRPIITESPAGHGQQIDPDVFTDPVSGKSYIYWGNGYMAGAELNDDMVSLKRETIKVMTPEGGTLQNYAFREGVHVFYRNGLYYFMWSVDDTGSPNYHVAYGTAKSPLGPIEVAKDPVVLIQRPQKEIYGTGHHTTIQVLETDEWYIVYHRINKHFIERRRGPGYHREVCIDRMEFNADGTIKPVEPTN